MSEKNFNSKENIIPQNSKLKFLASRNIIITGFLSAIVILVFVAGHMFYLFDNTIHDKVIVADTVNIGRLTTNEAEKKLKAAFQTLSPITALYQDKTWQINASDIDLTVDTAKIVGEAYNLGRTSNIWSMFRENYYLSQKEATVIPAYVNYNQDKLYKILADIALSIDQEPTNGQLKIGGNKIEIEPHINGVKVDITKTMSLIASKFSEKTSFSFYIAAEEVVPQVITEYLADIDGLLASYTTYFNSYDRNRTQNIIMAAKKINNTLIKSSEIFSFNDKVGLRLAEYGYLEAPSYINGKLVPDWGGGVCQVSSTLYNAVLLAGLDIEERESHFRSPEYVPMGQDATVADNLIDFKFKNILAQNIYITSLINGGTLTINVYGKQLPNSPEFQVISKTLKVLEPKTIVKTDPKLPSGKRLVEEKGAAGWVVATYRLKKVDGQIVNQEHLAIDQFPPIDRLERVGTKTL